MSEKDEADDEGENTDEESEDLMSEEVALDVGTVRVFDGYKEGADHGDLVVASKTEESEEEDDGPEGSEGDGRQELREGDERDTGI